MNAARVLTVHRMLFGGACRELSTRLLGKPALKTGFGQVDSEHVPRLSWLMENESRAEN